LISHGRELLRQRRHAGNQLVGASLGISQLLILLHILRSLGGNQCFIPSPLLVHCPLEFRGVGEPGIRVADRLLQRRNRIFQCRHDSILHPGKVICGRSAVTVRPALLTW
jgi:hypothetical protein